MTFGYIYDKHKSVDDISSAELVEKLEEEVGEFVEALENCDYASPHNCDVLMAKVIEEGCDVCHVVETILRYCGVPDELLVTGQSFVEYKNKLRGYYG